MIGVQYYLGTRLLCRIVQQYLHTGRFELAQSGHVVSFLLVMPESKALRHSALYIALPWCYLVYIPTPISLPLVIRSGRMAFCLGLTPCTVEETSYHNKPHVTAEIYRLTRDPDSHIYSAR